MKKQKFLLGAAGLLALGLTACSNELPVQEPQKAEADETRYMSVQISAPSDIATRAFQNGTGNESYINRLDFFFYDAAGRPTAKPVYMSLDDIAEAVDKEEAFFGDATGNNNVTRVYCTVVGAELTQGQNIPSQVVCIVNGSADRISDLENATLTQLIDKQRTSFRTDSYFTMSNSTYYGKNVLSGQENQRLCATPINVNTQLFSTRDKAVEAVKNANDADVNNDGAVVDIYVERLAAKVGLTMGVSAVSDYKLTDAAGNEVTLTFVPEFWTINASDKSVYLTKRYGVETSPAEYDEDGKLVAEAVINRTPDYADIAKALTGSEENSWWNDPANFRSYWGTSPSYFDDSYPDVSDDVNDLNGYTHSYSVNYWSYNDVKTQAGRTVADAGYAGIAKQALAWSTTDGFKPGENPSGELDGTPVSYSEGYIYTYETTASRYRIQDISKSNPAAVVASAVVVGKYQVGGAAVAAGSAFYIDRSAGVNGIYYPTSADVKTVLANRQRVLFSNYDADTEIASERLTSSDARLVVKHPDLGVREIYGKKLAGRLVTLQIRNDADLETNPIWFFHYNENGTGSYRRVTAQNLNEVNAQLLAVGFMDMFAEGLGFYSVPIRHLNWNDDLYTDGVYDWANMPTGALGVVRNHVYNLTINKIEGLATALRATNQPIVPAKEESNQYIAARLNVLAWNIVNSWEVDL